MAKKALILFAHGAGAKSDHPWMVRYKQLLQDSLGDDVVVETFDFPGPRKAETLVPVMEKALEENIEKHRPEHVVLVGKSMGSRVACHFAATKGETYPVRGVVAFGFPLRGDAKRAEVFDSMKVPMLFCQGEKDGMCKLDELEEQRKRLTNGSEVYVVPGGNHSLESSKTSMKQRSSTRENDDAMVIDRTVAFIRRVVGLEETKEIGSKRARGGGTIEDHFSKKPRK